MKPKGVVLKAFKGLTVAAVVKNERNIEFIPFQISLTFLNVYRNSFLSVGDYFFQHV